MFRAFVIKEFRHILRDGRTLMMLIGLPVALILLFGFAISTELRNVNVGVMVAEDDTFISGLVNRIDRSPYFTVTDRFTDETQVNEAMLRNEVDAVLYFGPEFSRRLRSQDLAEVSLITDATNPNNASTAMLYLSQIMQDYLQDEFGPETTAMAAVDTKIQATGAQSQNVTAAMPQGALTTDVRMLYNPQLKSAYNFVPGILGMIMILICVLMTSVSIVKEKETGTMEVLLVSPIKPMAIFVAKMLPYFVLSCIILLIVFLLIFFVLQVPVVGSLFWVIVVSLLYVVLSLGIGLMVSTMVGTQIAATTIAGLVFMIPVLMLSGMIYDVEGMPKAFYYVAQIIPAKWFITAIKKIMIEGMAVRYAMKEILILLGMTVLVFFVAIKNFNDRLE